MKLTNEQIKGNPLRVSLGGVPLADQTEGIREFLRQSTAPIEKSLPKHGWHDKGETPTSADKPAPKATDITATLTERGNRYGTFTGHAGITQDLKTVIAEHLEAREKRLAPDQQESLDMICHKIGRIINGGADYDDSWVDIAGYAKLVADRLQGVVR